MKGILQRQGTHFHSYMIQGVYRGAYTINQAYLLSFNLALWQKSKLSKGAWFNDQSLTGMRQGQYRGNVPLVLS